MIIAALMAGLFSGCAAVDGAIDERFDSIDRSAGKSRNEAVLRNIARASENIPLTFIAFSKITGGTTATGTAGAPSFILGPHAATNILNRDVTIGSTTLGGGAQATSGLDFTVLETGDFYRALLDPSDLVNFTLLARQGYPRELLFWLFADSVRITVNNRNFYEIHNRVKRSESCEYIPEFGNLCFSDMVDLAMTTGLAVEVIPAEREDHSETRGGAKSNRGASIIIPNIIVNTASDSSKQKLKGQLCRDPFLLRETAKFIKTDRSQRYSASLALRKLQILLKQNSEHLHICYTERPRSANQPGLSARRAHPEAPQQLLIRGQRLTFEIKTRSTFAMYQFLGQILAEDAMDKVVMTGLEKETASAPKILSISRDHSTACSVSVTVRNKFYCVPEHEESKNTKLIFSLLTQLIALKTQTKDIGITPTVRVSP